MLPCLDLMVKDMKLVEERAKLYKIKDLQRKNGFLDTILCQVEKDYQKM